MLQKNVILTAQTLGFFRAKDPEKQALIFEELLELTEFENENPEVLGYTQIKPADHMILPWQKKTAHCRGVLIMPTPMLSSIHPVYTC
jgi:hypothetical protein